MDLTTNGHEEARRELRSTALGRSSCASLHCTTARTLPRWAPNKAGCHARTLPSFDPTFVSNSMRCTCILLIKGSCSMNLTIILINFINGCWLNYSAESRSDIAENKQAYVGFHVLQVLSLSVGWSDEQWQDESGVYAVEECATDFVLNMSVTNVRNKYY